MILMMSAAAAAQLSVSDPGACLDVAALESELNDVDAAVSVAVSEGSIALAATAPDGRTWSRTLSTDAADCPHMAPVLARSVTRGLAELPALPELTPDELIRPDELRSFRSFAGIPVNTSIGLAESAVLPDMGFRVGVRWDSGVTLTNSSVFRAADELQVFNGIEVGWTRRVGLLSPELALGMAMSFDAPGGGTARLSLPVDFALPASWQSTLQLGPQLTLLQPLDPEASTRVGVGLSVQLLADHMPKRR